MDQNENMAQEGTNELEQFMAQENAVAAENPDATPVQEGKGKKKGGRKKSDAPKKEKAPKEPKPKKDNVAAVNAMTSIADVRKFLQIAIAKKAKSEGRPEAIARYEGEIAAARAKLEAMLAEAGAAADPVRALLDMHEEPNKIITSFINKMEAEQKAWFEANGEPTKSLFKTLPVDIPTEYFDTLGIDLQDKLIERHGKNDYRLQSVCRATNFIKATETGRFVKDANGKWIDPLAKKEVEKPAEAAPEIPQVEA